MTSPSSSSAAASPAWRPPTSSIADDVPFVAARERPRAGGVILSEQIDGFTIDAGPTRCSSEARRHQAVRGARARRSAGADQAAAPRVHPARRALHPLPAASVLGIPTAVGTVRQDAAVLVGRQSCGWAPSSSSPRASRRRGRIDRRVHDAPLRRAKRRPIWPSRCSPAFMPATSIGCRCARCSRASSKRKRKHGSLLRAFRRQPARHRLARRRVPLAARRLERDGARARRGPACRTSIRLRHARRARFRRTATGFRIETGVRRSSGRARGRPRDAGVCRRRRSFADVDAGARAAVRRDSVRVDGDDRARVPARRRRASAERIRLRRAAVENTRHHGRLVAVVEVAAPRAGGPRAAARVRRRRARSRARSSSPTRSSWRRSLRRCGRSSASRASRS